MSEPTYQDIIDVIDARPDCDIGRAKTGERLRITLADVSRYLKRETESQMELELSLQQLERENEEMRAQRDALLEVGDRHGFSSEHSTETRVHCWCGHVSEKAEAHHRHVERMFRAVIAEARGEVDGG